MERAGNDGQGAVDHVEHVTHGHQHTREQSLHDEAGVGSLASAPRWQVGIGLHGQAHQGGYVVGQHLGGHIHQLSVLGEARDSLQVQPVLLPLEGFLDAPALVVQVAEGGGRHLIGAEVGQQHTQLGAGAHVAHQTRCWRLREQRWRAYPDCGRRPRSAPVPPSPSTASCLARWCEAATPDDLTRDVELVDSVLLCCPQRCQLCGWHFDDLTGDFEPGAAAQLVVVIDPCMTGG